MGLSETLNVQYIDHQFKRWKKNPDALSEQWRLFFEGFEIGLAGEAGGAPDEEAVLRQARVEALKYRYRDIGHLLACMDPLENCPISHPLLELEAFRLVPEDLDKKFYTRRLSSDHNAALRDIVKALRETYCRSIGVEYMHIQDPAERKWLQEQMEPIRNRPEPTSEIRLRIHRKLCEAALFEQFLNSKYVGVTRFSLEGGDAVIPFFDAAVREAASYGCREIIFGMAHRGRLNVQAHILGKPYEDIFGEFESCYDPENLYGAGDVKYHNGFLADIDAGGDRSMRVFLLNNPSHLEAVNPVVEGFARARQELAEGTGRERVMALLIHGDAAFAGQGVVAETLNMSQLAGYRTGGTLHLVINNQIGYTTIPEDARSTRYATDIAKMLMVPVFHVHGEDPEAAVHIARLAVAYRHKFAKDVVVDLICYRRYGHNEGDEPYFTQPVMYDRIRQRPSLHEIYGEKLIDAGLLDNAAAEETRQSILVRLEAAYDAVHGSACPFPQYPFFENWEGFHGGRAAEEPDTGVPENILEKMADLLSRTPEGFSLHRKLTALLQRRREAVAAGSGIDWAGAESLAFGTLLAEGLPVRLSGQDSRRGTFSHRHSVLTDTRTGEPYTPLNAVGRGQGRFSAYNSLLAETSVLGFEYGYSLAQPLGLTIWEAQFGDFVNNAQSIVDLFIASGESKWQRYSGLTLLLPHGFEGLGPEHSSARLERFLQLCAEDNLQVCNPSTPAQYFHLLRRQAVRKLRKPLIVMTPKSLLRHPMAVSNRSDLAAGTFETVLADPEQLQAAETVLLCSGKIFYELRQRREDLQKSDTALVRIEQLYPFPEGRLETIFSQCRKAARWCWVQEEPENMGAWAFLRQRLAERTGQPVEYIGRPAAASPATGFPAIYRRQQADILTKAVGPAKPNAST